MEVDAFSTGDGQQGKIRSLEEKIKILESQIQKMEMQRTPTPATSASRKPFRWTPDGKPICGFCDRVGHIIKDCRKRKGREVREGSGSQYNTHPKN
jgi:hypothetical protein